MPNSRPTKKLSRRYDGPFFDAFGFASALQLTLIADVHTANASPPVR